MGMAFEGIWWHTVEYCVNLIVLRIVLKNVLKKKRTVSFLLNVERVEGSNIVAYYGILRHCYHYHMVNLHYS